MQNEFYTSAFRRKLYRSLEEIQADADEWIASYNNDRTQWGRHCFGETPMHTLHDSMDLVKRKQLDRVNQTGPLPLAA